MLEVVGINFAALNNIVGLNIVCILNDFESDILCGKNFLSNLQNLCMRSGRSGNGNCLACKSGIVNGCVIAVAGVFNNADNRAVILSFDEICNLLAFKSSFESLDKR